MFRRLIGRFVGDVGVAAVMLMAPGAPAAADTYTRQPGIDVQQYIFRIELKDGTRVISGQADIDLVFKTDGVAELLLDLIGASRGAGPTPPAC